MTAVNAIWAYFRSMIGLCCSVSPREPGWVFGGVGSRRRVEGKYNADGVGPDRCVALRFLCVAFCKTTIWENGSDCDFAVCYSTPSSCISAKSIEVPNGVGMPPPPFNHNTIMLREFYARSRNPSDENGQRSLRCP